ncbi:type II toxin-antitoxin system CcdA family antitoxin [Tabrizicola soli]|uniref:Type II toxin-antitoxin system CcdA family antitoxin n=1 Tax=Tabrizicola soli TaxID=2185115 RepID=A0ABV7DYL5_9RHOB
MLAQVRAARARRWKAENAEAVADCHKWVKENGMPLCRFRKV